MFGSQQQAAPPSLSSAATARADMLTERGFQLAFFITRERSAAIEAVKAAMDKFRAHRRREMKKWYWRHRNPARQIRTIMWDGRDSLQWLICSETQEFEIGLEQAGKATASDLVVHYTKHLIHTATSRSSFYVNVALQRILHDYRTPEAQRVYEWVTGRCPEAKEYRRVKGKLMHELQCRFDGFLRVCTSQHREQRFETAGDPSAWSNLLNRCLMLLTPWSTDGACHAVREALSAPSPLQTMPSFLHSHQNQLELRSSHVFIEPDCFHAMAKHVGIDPRAKRLSVPRLFLHREPPGGIDKGVQREDPPLTQDELNDINGHVSLRQELRRRIVPTSLIFIVEGTELARMDAGRSSRCQFEIEDGVKLIEIWAQGAGTTVLYATYWVEYTDWDGIASSNQDVSLKRRGKLTLETVPSSEGSRALIRAKWSPPLPFAGWESLLLLAPWIKAVPRNALLGGGLLAMGWILGSRYLADQLARQSNVFQHLRADLARSEAATLLLQRQLDAKPTSQLAVYRLVSDRFRSRGGHGSKQTVVSLPPQANLVNLELPLTTSRRGAYRVILKSFSDDKELFSVSGVTMEVHNGEKGLSVPVPRSLLVNQRDYVADVNVIDGVGRLTKVDSFTFHVTGPTTP